MTEPDPFDSSALACDRCDGSLLADADVRYVVKIEVVSAYDPLELVPGGPAVDLAAEIARIDRATAGMSEEELEATVYKQFTFDLCARCQREYLRDPLGRRPPGR